MEREGGKFPAGSSQGWSRAPRFPACREVLCPAVSGKGLCGGLRPFGFVSVSFRFRNGLFRFESVRFVQLFLGLFRYVWVS